MTKKEKDKGPDKINFEDLSSVFENNLKIYNQYVDSFKNLDASYFIKDNEFNVQNFYDKYPNLYNLNSFIKLLVEKQLINDDEIQELVFLD